MGDNPVLGFAVLLDTFNEFGLGGDAFDLLGLLFGVVGPEVGAFFLFPVVLDRQIVPVLSTVVTFVFGTFLLGRVALDPMDIQK